MEVMISKKTYTSDVTLRDKLLDVCIEQGPAWVLLFLIAVGIWREWPKLVSQVQSGYVENAVSLKLAADEFRGTTDRLIKQMIDDRQLMIELAREQRVATHAVAEQLRDEGEK